VTGHRIDGELGVETNFTGKRVAIHGTFQFGIDKCCEEKGEK